METVVIYLGSIVALGAFAGWVCILIFKPKTPKTPNKLTMDIPYKLERPH